MSEDQLLERRTTAAIIGAFYEVYNKLGYGFLEHVYSLALEREVSSKRTDQQTIRATTEPD